MARINVEQCRPDPCTGSREVDLLTRGLGPMFRRGRGGVIGGMLQAIAEWKTQLVAALCQEYAEGNPCTAQRRLPFWAGIYAFPPCVDLTSENLCAWVALVSDETCPPGSIGFLKKAIEFVAPGKAISIAFTPQDKCPPCDNEACPDENAFVITAPPEWFAWYTVERDYPFDGLDGTNPCRRYVIPEIECLRETIFPHGLSVGYRTDPPGHDGEVIFGVSDSAEIACPEPLVKSCSC